MTKNYFIFFKILLLKKILVLGGSNSPSAEENTYFLTSKSLLTYCQSNLPAEDGICQGYLAGVADSVYSGHLSDFISICVPRYYNFGTKSTFYFLCNRISGIF